MTSAMSINILKITKQLDAALQSLQIETQIPAVSHVYHPLNYAYDPYKNYVNKYCNSPKRVLYVGMNPSPHGMCQTGVPFGDVDYVKNWLQISGDVNTPREQHPRYPIVGYSHRTSEVSGSRLWGFLRQCYGEAERFFDDNFVVNYCPVALISSGGSNLTPESKEIQENPIKTKIEELCTTAMYETIKEIKPKHIIGIGRYAANLCTGIVGRTECNVQKVHYLRHPSPRSVQDVVGWEKTFRFLLEQNGLFNRNY